MIHQTKSVCPVCLKTLDAQMTLSEKEEILLSKTCPEHGYFSSVVWRGVPSYFDWTHKQIEHNEKKILRPLNLSSKECPHNCGLCPEHKQSTCTILLELTSVCNLSCPICFANSKPYTTNSEKKNKHSSSHNQKNIQNISRTYCQHVFEPLCKIYEKLDWIHKTAGNVILQLSGGEPTLYPHLIDVVKYASPLFPAVQLNTNGILLAHDKNLAKNLKSAGLSWIFLQFDAPSDDVNIILRGQKLSNIKNKAIENCKKAGLSVVLVSVLVRGINDHNISDLLQYALKNYPTVRGVHFQPMTKSGRNLKKDTTHITLPEVISLVSAQSNGQIKIEHAHAPDCEHTMCAFHCRYFVDKNLNLQYIYDETQKENPYKHQKILLEKDSKKYQNNPINNITSNPIPNLIQKNTLEILQNAPKRSVESVIRAWKGEESIITKHSSSIDIKHAEKRDAFDIFLAKAKKHIFSITCMAFQDVHTLDLQRLQQCCIHIYAQKKGKHTLVPFCAYNLTSLSGETLHRDENSTKK